MKFNPQESLTKHDVEIQVHTIQSIIDTLDEEGETTINRPTLEVLLQMVETQMRAMSDDD